MKPDEPRLAGYDLRATFGWIPARRGRAPAK